MNTNVKRTREWISQQLEEITDEELVAECDLRGCGPPEKGIEEFSADEVRDEFEHRFGTHSHVSVAQLYDEFRQRGDAPQILRDYIYDHCGRILP